MRRNLWTRLYDISLAAVMFVWVIVFTATPYVLIGGAVALFFKDPKVLAALSIYIGVIVAVVGLAALLLNHQKTKTAAQILLWLFVGFMMVKVVTHRSAGVASDDERCRPSKYVPCD